MCGYGKTIKSFFLQLLILLLCPHTFWQRSFNQVKKKPHLNHLFNKIVTPVPLLRFLCLMGVKAMFNQHELDGSFPPPTQ